MDYNLSAKKSKEEVTTYLHARFPTMLMARKYQRIVAQYVSGKTKLLEVAFLLVDGFQLNFLMLLAATWLCFVMWAC
ncbi:unnamed protein product [Lathyrus oleraceus]|uniref:uncharacterized protein LOC127129060 isoform X2 n=1 Tax=Pisum sativum TaxID=3888 RepID=UPI001FC52954|nr:uncharacterized protein LOC127129060 isoform X2 [Pisum sativum]